MKVGGTPPGLLSDRPLFWLAGASAIGLFYLAVSAWGFGFSGFPLDDAWIHQTYARNLAYNGQWAFTSGAPSAGSTAPLWSLLLSLGYLLGIPFKIWTYGLGMILLGLTGWTMTRLGKNLFPEQPQVGLWAGLFCLFEWHLIWTSVSGMETILFVWLSIFLVERYLQTPTANFSLGLLGGLLFLTRPEGLGLIGLIGLDMTWRHTRDHRRQQERDFSETKDNSPSDPFSSHWFLLLRRWLWLSAGVCLLLTPYLAFHLWNTGLPFPNTFYAKQAEYRAILEEIPLWQRLFGGLGEPLETVQGVFRVIFIGAQILLLPGLFFAFWLTVTERRLNLGFMWIWWIGFLLLYGLRLPVTYQHGRYQIPAIPWIILLGVWGIARLLAKIPHRNVKLRVIRQALVLSLMVLTVAFTIVGSLAYSRDVRFIESEMVAAAHWIEVNIPPTALIAVHDIGAIGYFTQRPLLDLAGLITPEVIPIIRDETALFDFLTIRQADYLVTFPSWYPYMTKNTGLIPLYRANASGIVDNMVVYRIDRK